VNREPTQPALKGLVFAPEGYFDAAGVLNTKRSMYYSSGFVGAAAAGTDCDPSGAGLAVSCRALSWSGADIVSSCDPAVAGEIQFFANLRSGTLAIPNTNATLVTAATIAAAAALRYRPAAGAVPATAAAPGDTDLSRAHFTLRAAGAIGSNVDEDVWFINDAKQLVNVQNGTP